MGTVLLLGPTDLDDEVSLADWLEATMVVENREFVSRARIRKYLRAVFADDQPDVPVEILLGEVARRSRHAQRLYPFWTDGSGVRYTRSLAATPYLFMLCLSVSKPYRDEHRYKDTDELFDSLVLDALKSYLGRGGQGVRFGSPGSGRRPANFRDGITWLRQEMNLGPGAGRPRPRSGDSGLDVIAWRPFRDGHSAYIVVLAQCTVQLNWPVKARDVTEDTWRGWIDFAKDPHLALAIPFVIPQSSRHWDELRRDVHTILDRLRLAELLEDVSLKAEAKIQQWIASEVHRMGGAA